MLKPSPNETIFGAIIRNSIVFAVNSCHSQIGACEAARLRHLSSFFFLMNFGYFDFCAITL